MAAMLFPRYVDTIIDHYSLKVLNYPPPMMCCHTELRYQLRSQLSKGMVDVLLCTYTIFEREASKIDRAFLCAQQFEFLVLDEAHCIKNASSSRFEHLNMLKTKHRLLLSGTPVQNDLRELLALLSFLMPKMIGRHQIEYLLDSFGWVKGTSSTSGEVMSSRSLAQLRGMLAPFVLRRLKQDVLDQLANKETVIKKLPMSDSQKSVYENILLGHALRKDALKAQRLNDAEASRLMDGKMTGIKGCKVAPPPAFSIISNQALIDLTQSPSPSSVAAATTTDLMESSADVILTAATTKTEVLIGCGGSANEAGSSSSIGQIVGAMSQSEANHLFTALRKAANHPLLLR